MPKVLLLSLSVLLLLLSSGSSLSAAQEQKTTENKIDTIKFNGSDYYFRWSQAGQYEFTPAGQEDLNSWTEMLTLRVYPKIIDGDSLATQANGVLSNYKNSKGNILRTNSIPSTAEKPAEHFIAAMLGGPQFLEFAAARFLLVGGKGVGVIYSRRAYGTQAPQELGPWVVQNGAPVEKVMMEFNPATAISSLEK